jgi:flagellar biosynthesis component FlhA
MEQQASLLKSLIKRPQEYLVGFGVVMVLAVMVMPIPPFLLDLLLSFSITLFNFI